MGVRQGAPGGSSSFDRPARRSRGDAPNTNAPTRAGRLVAILLAVCLGVVLLATLGGAGTASAAQEVDSCTAIDESGSYELSGNLTDVNRSHLVGSSYQSNQDACISIQADDVHLDGNGHRIDWNGTASAVRQRAVYVNGSVTRRDNVTVRNVEVTDWPRGVRVYNATDVHVEDATVRPEGVDDTRAWKGIYLIDTADSVVARNTLSEASIESEPSSRGAVTNANNRYENNEVWNARLNIGEGSANVTVVGNELDYAVEHGTFTNFVESDGGTVAGNRVDGNGTLALTGTNLTVERNVVRDAYSASYYGIDLEGNGFTVRNNTVTNSSRGMTLKGDDHLLRENELRDNGESFHIAGQYVDYRTRYESDLMSLDVDTSNTVDGSPVYVFQGVAGHTFANADAGYLAYVNSTDVTVRDVDLRHNTDGLFLAHTSNVVVENATLSANANGLEVKGGSDVTVTGSRLVDNSETGVAEAPGSGTLAGATFSNNEIRRNGLGVHLGVNDLTVVDNNVTDNGEGIRVEGAENAILRGNDVSRNDAVGAWAAGRNVTVRDNDVADNGGHGVYLGRGGSGSDTAVVGNRVENNGETGVLVGTVDARLADNVLVGNADAGIHVRSDGGAVVRNNTARDNRYGVRLYWYDSGRFHPEVPVDDNVLEENVLSGNTYGISVGTGSGNNTIRANTVVENSNGISLDEVAANRLHDNNVSANGQDGIYVDDATASPADPFVVRNNTAVDNGDEGIELRYSTGSGTGHAYVVSENDLRRNADVGVRVADARNVTVADNGVVRDNGGYGIVVVDTVDVSVLNHTVTGNRHGLLVSESDATVRNLTATGNDHDGVRVLDTGGLVLRHDVTAADNGGDGVYVEDSKDVHVRRVPADRNGEDGVEFVDSWNSTVADLSASDNGLTGLAIRFDDGPVPDNVTARNLTLERNAAGVESELTNAITVADSSVQYNNATKPQIRASTGPLSDEYVVVNGSGIVAERSRNATYVNNTLSNNDGRGMVVTGGVGGSTVAENVVVDNGGNGIEYRKTSGASTVANNTVGENGGTALYGPSTRAVNGENGVHLRDASNVSVLDNTVEHNARHGVRVRGDSDDNVLRENVVRAHTTANASGHGVFVESFLHAAPADNRIVDNDVVDNDYGVTLFDESGSTVRDNDVRGNAIGIRFGSSTEPVTIRETTECTQDGDLRYHNDYAGATGDVLADNRVESGRTALKLITHPSTVVMCDGAVERVDRSDPTFEDNRIENNRFEAPEPVNVTRSRLDYPSETYGSELNGSNAWNATRTDDGNVLGGRFRAGNYWATPGGSGFSQTCSDGDGDGICDGALTIGPNNADEQPLAAAQPDYVTAAIDSTTSPVAAGETLSVTATFTNHGDGATSQTASLSVDGSQTDTAAISLAPGESTTVTFTWATGDGDVGDHTVTVASEDAATTTGVTVTSNEDRPPTVDLTAIDASATPSAPPAGRTVHTNGTLGLRFAANGTPGTPATVTAVLEATFANFEHDVPASHQSGETWTATADLSGLPDDGTYAVNATATDAAGQTNETAAPVAVRLDREAPRLGATVARVDDTTGRVDVTASEALAGQPTVVIERPDGTTATVPVGDAGDRRWNGTFALGGGGQYDVTATGADRAGNRGRGTATTLVDTVETENGSATVVLRPSGLFVDFTTDRQVNDTVVVTESNTPLAPLATGQAGANFLNAQLGDAIAGNLSHAVVGVPVDMGAVPASVAKDDVSIRYYNETAGTWERRETTVETRTVDGTTGEYWVANVTHFSTYAAVATDDTAPSLESATPSGELAAGTTTQEVRFEYSDDLSGVDPGAVTLAFDGTDVTGADAASITSRYATYKATGLEAGSYVATVTVQDEAGNAATYRTSFTVPEADDGDDSGSGSDGGSRYSGGTSDPATATPTPTATETTTPTPTTTATPTVATEPATATETPTATETAVSSPTEDDAPGFGPVAVLVALVAGLWLVGRRR